MPLGARPRVGRRFAVFMAISIAAVAGSAVTRADAGTGCSGVASAASGAEPPAPSVVASARPAAEVTTEPTAELAAEPTPAPPGPLNIGPDGAIVFDRTDDARTVNTQ